MTYRFVSLFALIAATPALAQQAPGEDTIVVTATRSGDAVPVRLTGSSVTVIDDEALETRQTRILSDVLRDVPGVAVNRAGAIGGQTQVRVRGSESNHVLVFIDGIKASDPAQGEFDFSSLLADEGARVEVLRGQQSSLYGSDAIGGVITYTTMSGREAPGLTARAEGGSFGTFTTAGRAAGTVGEDFDYAVSGSYLTTDGYTVAPGGQRDLGASNLGASAKLNWTPAPNFRLTAVGRYSVNRAETNDQDIGAASPIVQGYPVNIAVDTPGSEYRNRAYYGLVRAELSLFDDALTTALSGQITDASVDRYGSFGGGTRGRRYRANFENTVRFGDGRVSNRATAAVDYEREEFRNIDPSGFAFTGKQHLETVGFVAQYDVTLDDRLAIGAAARIDANDYFKDTATYRITGSYLLPTGTRLRAAYGTGVKAPTPFELFGYSDGEYIGNPDLRPERSKGWEAGIEQRLLDGAMTVGATYFRNRFTDQIETISVFDNGNFLTSSRNNDAVARQQGVEVYGNTRLGDFRFDAAYTWLRAPQTVEVLVGPAPVGGGFQAPVPAETQAVRRPRHSGSVNISYVPDDLPVSATLTVRHNGRQRDYAFNSFFQRLLVDMRPFTLVNLNAAWDVGPNLQIFGRVENLLDKDYQELFGYMTPGRAAYGGVRVRL